jgi:hypothetical protein
MITYIAIRVTNGDYYWGSTTDLNRREAHHRKSKANDWFHRSLRKHQDEWMFIEVWNEDDPKRTREQFLLDLHHGRVGCLNHSPTAGGGKQPGSGWGLGENNISKRIEVRRKISEATKGKSKNHHPKYKKPWANAQANKDVWKLAPDFLRKWNEFDKPNSSLFARLLGMDRGPIRKMVKLFQNGWIPEEDNFWVEYFCFE